MPRLAADTYGLDLNTHLLWRGGEWVHLTHIEGGILECLMRVPGHVKSRAQLLDYAWPHAANPIDRTVDDHIKRIRRKCDSAFGGIDIRVIYNGGYVFDGAVDSQTKHVCAVCGSEIIEKGTRNGKSS